MIGYKEVNQQKIYNSRTKKIHISASVWFDKSFDYYNTSHEVTNEDNNGMELGNIQNEADDEEFGKVMARKQVARRDAILPHFTLQSQKEFIVIDNEEEEDNNSFLESIINNDYPLPNQLILLSTVLKSSVDLQEVEDIFRSLDILFGDNTSDQPASLCQLHTKFAIIKCIDYKNPKKLSKAMSAL